MKNSTRTVPLKGTLTAAQASVVRRQLRSLIADGVTCLLIDLSAVSFIDSSGLSALVTAFKAARAVGGDVVLLQPQPNVRALLELTRLHRVFQIFDDVQSAQTALAA